MSLKVISKANVVGLHNFKGKYRRTTYFKADGQECCKYTGCAQFRGNRSSKTSLCYAMYPTVVISPSPPLNRMPLMSMWQPVSCGIGSPCTAPVSAQTSSASCVTTAVRHAASSSTSRIGYLTKLNLMTCIKSQARSDRVNASASWNAASRGAPLALRRCRSSCISGQNAALNRTCLISLAPEHLMHSHELHALSILRLGGGGEQWQCCLRDRALYTRSMSPHG